MRTDATEGQQERNEGQLDLDAFDDLARCPPRLTKSR